MSLPTRITETRLWSKVGQRPEYGHAIEQMRAIAERIAAQAERIVPDYTDHSVRHMDALWAVADQALTPEETHALTSGEALILAGAFYLHDLGMAFACTNKGLEEVRSTQNYTTTAQRLQRVYHVEPSRADTLAVRLATREIHAKKALDLATIPIPGLDCFLIESKDFRERWANLFGQVAASHHWGLDEVHKKLGGRNSIPSPGGDAVDLGFVACMLRVIDYAHINRERVANLDRALRSEISADSVLHWDAQANITGPLRIGDQFVYSCTNPLEDVDAWWLFFDLASGLDNEIRRVRDYLKGRAVSANRFSLQGVAGIESPEHFRQYVQLGGDIAPIDVRVQPHSMERIVELLGGKHLYGADSIAPLRELIQNARDAIHLRAALEKSFDRAPYPGKITIVVDEQDGEKVLMVKDTGVGMTRDIVATHLIGVGSDYWHSVEFFRDYGRVLEGGFEPIGKFGIGFLSVFMIGDRIEVETEVAGSKRVKLRLRGLGRRGELAEVAPTGETGTEVRVWLKPAISEQFARLGDVVRARAPMLTVPLEVRVKSGGSFVSETIEPGWWKHVDDDKLLTFVKSWRGIAYLGKEAPSREVDSYYYSWRDVINQSELSLLGWPGLKPQVSTDSCRVVSSGGLKSFGVLRCSLGVAIDQAYYPDLTGMIELGRVDLTASRDSLESSHIAGPGSRRRSTQDDEVSQKLISLMRPELVAKLNDLERYGMIPSRLGFVRGLAKRYGTEVLRETSLRWIPVLEPPGNVIHRSRAELIEMLGARDKIIVGTGMGLGSAYTVATASMKSPELGQTLAVPLRTEEVRVDYSERQQLKREAGAAALVGSLNKVLGQLPEGTSDLRLLPLIVETIAEAWGRPVEDLYGQAWTLDLESSIFWCPLSRAEASRVRTSRAASSGA